MKKYVCIATLAVAFFACDNGKNKSSLPEEQIVENETVIEMPASQSAQSLLGTYEGTLPAASCPGIKTTLTLNDDSSFTLRSEYLNEKDGVFNSAGTYTIEGSLITTQDSSGEINYFQAEEGQIRILNQDKQAITGDLADNYILKKINS